VTLQIVDLARQVVLDGVPDAFIQKLRLFRAIEITVEIGGLVLTLDDVTTSRKAEKLTPRDNVVFELGLFISEPSAANAIFLFTNKNRI
jgi:predicted nucleotide-binding protein